MVIKAAIPRGHVVALTMPAWGHAKAACALLAKIVRCQPVHATIFTGASLSEKVVKEIDTQFLPDVENDLRKLIRVTTLESGPSLFDLSLLNTSFVKEYKNLFDNKCASPDSEISIDGSEPGPPQLVILDFFMYEALQNIRAISGDIVPVYALQSASAAASIYIFGPEEIGGHGDLAEKFKSITHTDQEAIEEESLRMYRRLSGQLIELPGIPPMYDHEHSPQKSDMPKGAMSIIANSHKFLNECDGAVMNTTPLYEELSIKAFQEWFGRKPVISSGPFDFPLIERQKTVSTTATEVEAFLDSALEKYGPNSVIYISFGSVFWPLEPEKLWAVLDILIEQEVPFIFAHASPFAVIPDEIKEKIKASGLGYSSSWLPQTTILSHKACGWFVSHCGHNSVTEALSDGVPLVCWPFEADQPTNAANVAFVHKLGYELFEVRTGTGLRPIHRLGDRTPEGTVEAAKNEFRETLKKMRGEDGAIKRANVQKFRDELAKLWAPGGASWQGIKRITDILQ